MKKTKPEIVWSIIYLSCHLEDFSPEVQACYEAYCKMSYPEQAVLDGYVTLLSKKCGSLTGAFELIAKMGLLIAEHPEAIHAHETTT